ncbi:MAG: GNAT family N-acetyltransferase [Acidobacteriota bacterium]
MADASLTIRRATAADWPALWPIIRAVIAGEDTYSMLPDTPEDEVRTYWMGPGCTTYVAEKAGTLVGTYVIRPNRTGLGDHVANGSYMVAPERAGEGIGFAMGQHSLAEAREAGYQAMQFNAVVATNHRAVALWQRLGFAIVGTVPRAFRHRVHGLVDLHVMHRFL